MADAETTARNVTRTINPVFLTLIIALLKCVLLTLTTHDPIPLAPRLPQGLGRALNNRDDPLQAFFRVATAPIIQPLAKIRKRLRSITGVGSRRIYLVA